MLALASVCQTPWSTMLGEGQFEDLDEDANAIAASISMTTALQQVTGLGDRYALIVTYQKSLNIHVAELTQKERHRSELFPLWAIHAVAGILSGTVILGFSIFVCWLGSTFRHHQRLRSKQQAVWEAIPDDAEAYTTSLGCPMALVCAADFVDFGCLVQYETSREEGKLRFLDAIEQLNEFRKHCLIIFFSHQWLAWSVPDPNGLHYQTMRAAVCKVTTVANVSLDKVFLWVDFCSIPQEHCQFKFVSAHFLILHTRHPGPGPTRTHIAVMFRSISFHPRNTWLLGSSSLPPCRCM